MYLSLSCARAIADVAALARERPSMTPEQAYHTSENLIVTSRLPQRAWPCPRGGESIQRKLGRHFHGTAEFDIAYPTTILAVTLSLALVSTLSLAINPP